MNKGYVYIPIPERGEELKKFCDTRGWYYIGGERKAWVSASKTYLRADNIFFYNKETGNEFIGYRNDKGEITHYYEC